MSEVVPSPTPSATRSIAEAFSVQEPPATAIVENQKTPIAQDCIEGGDVAGPLLSSSFGAMPAPTTMPIAKGNHDSLIRRGLNPANRCISRVMMQRWGRSLLT
ncbi:hypothetical protein [Plantibacter sp. CFBP 13570]|uniref:hypothetical protein n=1 Tax=Plantibacter sp. CFBP 13570 TaxID=2775272 RepID=UPI001930A472|nr:hypothetical protein [Plantibacter sp. CFBP 13570]MBD8534606.1 hypothetical protein [Plantibacter sp. CFBP 13570]